jgi:hypothetical protein
MDDNYLILICKALFFGVALWSFGMIFLVQLKKKEHFKFKTILFLFASCIINIFMNFMYLGGINSGWQEYSIFYTFFVLLFLFCAQTPFTTALYYGIWSFITFELGYELWTIFNSVGILTVLEGNWYWLNNLWIFIIFNIVLAFTVARGMPENGRYEVGPRQLTSAILLLFIYEMFREMLFEFGETTIIINNWRIIVLTQIYCLTVLYLQSVLFRKSAMRQQMITMDLLWHQQKDQYKLAKENIALINQKCHDLKHQMAAMRWMMENENGEKFLNEIEKSIRIYDSIVKTGNEVLDTILTEKSLYCEANQIKISCVADGSKLNFMDPIDLYTILGNAIDNAIESVQQFYDEEKRIIDVLIYTKKQFLIINISNPSEQALTFEDDLPISTKIKNGYHGYGLKSIRHTVRKYNGSVKVDVEDNCFYLKIVITMP